MRKHYMHTQQANKQTINWKTELLTALPSVFAWAHGNQLHREECCDWSVFAWTVSVWRRREPAGTRTWAFTGSQLVFIKNH